MPASFAKLLYRLFFKPFISVSKGDKLYSKLVNVYSKALNVRSQALNVHSVALNIKKKGAKRIFQASTKK